MHEPVPDYRASRIHERIAEDPEVAELGVRVTAGPGWLLVDGEVATAERRDHIVRIVAEEAPDLEVRCDITVVEAGEPGEEEVLS